MPSPFPGMDPWLERPGGWLPFHNPFIAHLAEHLNPKLVPKYAARTGEYLFVERQDRSISPDVYIVRRPAQPRCAGEHAANQVGTLVAEHDVPIVFKVPAFEVREWMVEVFDTKTGRVVTVIELASPSNKMPSGAGRKLYQKRHRAILASRTNLVEIDLLRAGRRVVCAPASTLRKLSPFDYLVSVLRRGEVEQVELYPVGLRHRLPRIAVPLGKRDADVVADLQAVFDETYDRGAHAYTNDYDEAPPAPPLAPDDAKWAEALLRKARLRK